MKIHFLQQIDVVQGGKKIESNSVDVILLVAQSSLEKYVAASASLS